MGKAHSSYGQDLLRVRARPAPHTGTLHRKGPAQPAPRVSSLYRQGPLPAQARSRYRHGTGTLYGKGPRHGTARSSYELAGPPV